MSFLSQTHISLVTMSLSGFPILNDPLYNHPAWGEERGAKGQGIKDINTVIHSNTNSIGLTLNNVDDNVDNNFVVLQAIHTVLIPINLAQKCTI